ncbi:dienelactone hydrolase family protein [Loktanella sp. SALINAS62]|uniref:dienelactone hydrolase family protein n=1 Tax=Loktanella sp. SALINAS62 TaxID=2706124 RepID=UPI001B8AAC79|nr:dienelactone hydrolase family protein [Loktanella sp. SALINAS62]MBS1303205.1 dienelactone hydrolase family protein [Loktanella sp. SALINAS62]
MKTIAMTAAASLIAGAVQAELIGEYHSYDIDGVTFEGYVATNTDLETPRGTVLIVHDWDGMTDYEERRADMLAAQGYTAFAIDVYGADTDPQGMEEYQALSGEMYGDRDTFRARLMGAIAEAANITGATDNIVMIGYCFGGAAVLEAARAGADIDGFVSFHGGLDLPEGQDYSGVQAPVMLFHGSADPVSGMDALASLLTDLNAAGVTHGAEVFGGARHSFTVFGSDDYDLTADQGSWDGLQTFLSDSL